MGLYKSFSEYDSEIQKATIQYSGLLGLTIGGSKVVNLPSRAGYVYVRLRDNQSEVIQAYNDKVSPVYDFPVLVQRLGNRWIVAGKDTQRYETFGTSAPFLPAHGSQHSFNRDLGTGADTVWVHADQFMPLLVYPSGSAGAGNLMVAPYLLQRDSDFVYVGNTGTPNLLVYKPTNNQAIMGLVCMNTDTGNPDILIASGTPMSAVSTGTSYVANYLPFPSTNQQPLYAFRLVSGTSRITWDNLYNARQFYGGNSGGGNVTGTATPGGNNTEVQYNSSGAFTGDPQFTWRNATKSLGIGDPSKFPFSFAKMLWMVGDGESPSIFGLAYGSDRAPFITFAKGDGTATGTTNVKLDQVIGRIRGRGYDGYDWSNTQAEVRIVADGNWGTGNHPTRLEFWTTPSGTSTMALAATITDDGHIDIASGKEYRVNGAQHTHTDKEDTANKATAIAGNEADTTKYPSTSAVYGFALKRDSNFQVSIGRQVTIADNAVYSFTPPVSAGVLIVQARSAATTNYFMGFFVTSTGGSLSPTYSIGSNVNLTTGTLTGTTGTDGKLTLSVNTTTGVIYVENRTGQSRNIVIKCL